MLICIHIMIINNDNSDIIIYDYVIIIYVSYAMHGMGGKSAHRISFNVVKTTVPAVTDKVCRDLISR